MEHDIIKLCADSLRAFTLEKYGVKLKPSHAHELVPAFFGYSSKNAMLADTKYPISNISQAEIVVLAPTAPIDQRRKNLQGLSLDLPDTYTLAEGVYSGLISKWPIRKPYPTYEILALSLADEGLRQQRLERTYRAPVGEGVKVKATDEGISLTVSRFYQIPTLDGLVHEANITTIINLPRIAAHIGYGRAHISVEVEPLGEDRQHHKLTNRF
jgi:hypothetical protein